MKKPPFISFIIPCYNSGSTINNALISIVNQFNNNDYSFEIVLVAENEQDTTFKRIDVNKYNDVNIRFYFSYYPGVTANRNKGLREAKGKYVYFLDSDDVLVNGDWSEVLRFLELHEEIDAMFGKTDGFNDECDYYLDRYNAFITEKEQLDSFYGEFGLVNYAYYSYIFKKDFLINNDIFIDDNISNLEDYLFVGLFLSKSPCLYVSRYTFNRYIKNDNTLSNNKSLTTAVSGAKSFSTLLSLLENNSFCKSVVRYKYLFVTVVMDIGIFLHMHDRRMYENNLKEINVRRIIKSSIHSNKRTLYLLCGLRLGWFVLKIIRKVKGIK